jgi:type IV pilus assembly protein PilW
MRKQGGLSLIEIMVGMAVGLVGTVAIMQVYAVNEEMKRTTVSTGEAQLNGTLALFSMERDLRMAGWGMSDSQGLALGCTSMHWAQNGVAQAVRSFVPASLNNKDDAPDELSVIYGTDSQRMLPTTLTADMADPDSDLALDNAAGIDVGDVLMLVETGKDCTLMQVTAIAPGGVLTHTGSGYFNPPPGTVTPTYAKGALVFNLGQPVGRRFAISEKGHLTATDFLTAGAEQTISPDVIDMQAEYGWDDGSNGGTVEDRIVDRYSTVSPANRSQWKQILALRVAVLARSGKQERATTVGGEEVCNATTEASFPRWGEDRANTFPMLPREWDGSAPFCYRYRVFETVIPLRNVIWRKD